MTRRRVMSIYGWIVIFLLLAILVGAVFVAHYGWVLAGDVIVPAWGWWMMGLGIFFSLLVGCGLMALIFYSSRAGFDEAPELEPKRHRVHKLVKRLTHRNESKKSARSQ
jgi:hypothetical protein